MAGPSSGHPSIVQRSSLTRIGAANVRPPSVDDVNAIYPPPSRELMYRQSMSFVDSSPELGQVFPGFPLDMPTVE